MAWWTDILDFRKRFLGLPENENEINVFAVLVRAFKKFFYDNFVDTIHICLLVATYAYFALSVFTFFFQYSLPRQVGYIMNTFSEPYLGVLGIYIVVNEIRRRRGRVVHPHFINVFVAAWVIFLIISTLTVILSGAYFFNDIYRIVVTNSLAAFIIRLGTVLSKIPP